MNYILLEDEPITALALKRMLSCLRPEWTLLAMSDQAADIPSLMALGPDVILSDVFLCDGPCIEIFETCASAVPVILLSGYPLKRWQGKKDSGIIAFIEKPVSRHELEQVLLLVENLLSQFSPTEQFNK